ncbi:IMS domain-containing protein [Brunnivagina elsteri]|uniref:Molecular chaperone DnaJ n=1 Tax=Brunnivagina elsteri CCALA 953 TaxID=987040 RepID=A0A2A2TEN5_9CYAN|nr:IMS domain-containing protein [Calothrix elsteri]PAX52108.1 molecular chaperone DnaJ [Calothrix elsteri CCALA 953]
MRIPLDYYRILGLPLAASEEQLRQAYGDRIVQLPRREYSQAAITSRKQLIEEAYVVLSDSKERKAYDKLYLANAYTPDGNKDVAVAVEDRITANRENIDTRTLSIEVNQDELVGALLILQELGEYEQVLKLGRPYLVNKHNSSNNKLDNTTSNSTFDTASERPDVVLTVSLACLELGREQWQQGHYENAAISLETGEELLAREGMFPSVRTEIQADLNRLRPYRILELLALPEEKTSERRQGLQLLQEILEERGGIDGSGDDQSGLSIDDFLRFVQQLRHYLTVNEQHRLFEAESKRPSAVATYLAVYASIARGFTQRHPALIRQAKQMLARLGKRQDVHLEQSLCALLLGQTEEATRALELSQEYEALAFIRETSQDSPDLLPGLCLYSERWLQNEVFPHFRDLGKQSASLKDYYADQQVQSYLEALPTGGENINDDWNGIERKPLNQPASHVHSNGNGNLSSSDKQNLTPSAYPNSNYSNNGNNLNPQPNYNSNPSERGRAETPNQSNQNRREYSSFTPEHINPTSNPNPNPNQSRNGYNEPPITRITGYESGYQEEYTNTSVPQPRQTRRKPQSAKNSGQIPDGRYRTVSRRRTRPSPAKGQLLLKILGSLAGVFLFLLLASSIFGWLKNVLTSTPPLQGEQLAIQINEPPIKIPEPGSQEPFSPATMTKEAATQVVQAWLAAKSASLGPNHEVDSLDQILTGSALKHWRGIVLQVKAENRYRRYKHTVDDVSFEIDTADKDHVSINASVTENTTYYENNLEKKTDKDKVKVDKVKVKYELTRVEAGWRIRDISLVN